jgi:hypothetical protein
MADLPPGTVELGEGTAAEDIAAAADAIWISNGGDGTVARITP